ncbi:neuromedin-B isoform X6 [Cuculus canorus]|uniref:neuromedin-B isoform X6 n=1 Tax=Cuculus canorus TaxID=55661 RepID=UPI0023AA7C22|nr:neuromedin-B isoform X6 [Cuculus canorus]
MWALRCLVLLLCGAALGPAVHLDFAEHRSQAAKIKVNPRGNLWATGHFMGKKSVTGSPHLEPPEEPAVPTAFGPSLRALLEEMVELLTRELLRVLWRERLLDENQGKYDLTDQAEQPQLSQPVLTPTAPCPPYAEESRTGRRTPVFVFQLCVHSCCHPGSRLPLSAAAQPQELTHSRGYCSCPP